MRHGWSAAAAIVAVSVTFAAVRRISTRPATANAAGGTASGARAEMPIYSGALARLDSSLVRLDASLGARDTQLLTKRRVRAISHMVESVHCWR